MKRTEVMVSSLVRSPVQICGRSEDSKELSFISSPAAVLALFSFLCSCLSGTAVFVPSKATSFPH